SGEIDAHLPRQPRAAASERAVGHRGELPRPEVETRLPRRAGHLIEGVHPLGQVVEVLAVPVPLELLVERLVRAALRQLLADPQTALRGMGRARLLAEPADPTAARIVGAMFPERVMDPVDQLE